MNIVYTTNDLFCAKVGASICSIFENNKSADDITIFIIGQSLSTKNIKNFSILASEYHRKIEIIPLDNLNKFIPFTFDTSGWNPIVLARLILDHLLPESIDRILYIDGDTVILRSLSALWNTDLKGNVLGGCIEATQSKKRRISLKMESDPYINAGVLLIDLKKWRSEQTGLQILNYYAANNGKLFANDQDAINGTLRQKITFLPPKYNFYNIYWFYPYRYLKKLMRGAYYYHLNSYEDSLSSPAIIHYLGEERPWRKGNHHRFKKEYQYYLSLTPWNREPEESGWQTYFFCWDIFNFCMKPFPALRYHIIDTLIPTFLHWRKKQLKKN